jgi:hypothetical protein
MNNDLLDNVLLLSPGECAQAAQNKDDGRKKSNSRGETPSTAVEGSRRSNLKMAKNVDDLNTRVNESAIIRYGCLGLETRDDSPMPH